MSAEALGVTGKAPRRLHRRGHAAAFLLACADCRHPDHVARAMRGLGFEANYFDARAAGGALPLCVEQLRSRDDVLHGLVEPLDAAPASVEAAILAQLDASKRFLPRHRKICLMHHQDCAAFKAFAGGLEYPARPSPLRSAKALELSIHAEALIAAKARLAERVHAGDVLLGVLDAAGACGLLDEATREWTVVVPAAVYDSNALFTPADDDVKAAPQALRPPAAPGLPPQVPAPFPPSPPLAPASSPRLGAGLCMEVACL